MLRDSHNHSDAGDGMSMPMLSSSTRSDKQVGDGSISSGRLLVAPTSSDSEDELFGLSESSNRAQCLYVLLCQSAPIMTSLCLEMSGNMISLFFAARCKHPEYSGKVIFAGISLAVTFASFSFYAIIVGMSSAIDTLGSQLNGAGKYREVGILLHRSCIILSIITLPVLFTWWNSYWVFLNLGVEPEVCAVIQHYLRIHILSMPIEIFNVAFQKHITAVGRPNPTLWANIGFVVAVIVLDMFFITWLRLDHTYLAIAWVLACHVWGGLQFAMSLQYEEVRRTFRSLPLVMINTKEVWSKWGEFFFYGVPGTIMTCSEWWGMEILTVMAVKLGTPAVAAETIVTQYATTLFMIPLGISIATTSLIGNSIGAGRPRLAREIGQLAVGYTALMEIFIAAAMFFYGSWFISIYTRDMQVRALAESTIPVLIIATLFDGMQSAGSAILKGTGKQHLGAVINVIAYYVLGLPMSWICCFQLNYGVAGLIMGLVFANVFQVLLLVLIFSCFDGYVYSTPATLLLDEKKEEEMELLKLDRISSKA